MKGRLLKTAVLLVLALLLAGTGGVFSEGRLCAGFLSFAAEHGGQSPVDSGKTVDEAETKEVSMDLNSMICRKSRIISMHRERAAGTCHLNR